MQCWPSGANFLWAVLMVIVITVLAVVVGEEWWMVTYLKWP